ncbi:MAG: LamG domain-containing protein [Candidatus Thorarchaeota archaeon]
MKKDLQTLRKQQSIASISRILQKTAMISIAALLIIGMVLPLFLITSSMAIPNISYQDNSRETETGLAGSKSRIPPNLCSPATTDDWLEDNEDFANAKDITLGNLTSDLRAAGNDEDYFRILPSPGYFLMIEIHYNASETDFDLRVYDSPHESSLVIEGNSTGPIDAVRLVPITSPYYARVFVSSGMRSDSDYDDTQLYTYDLKAYLEDDFGSNFYQHNNDTQTAADLPTTGNPTDSYEDLTVSSLIRPNDMYRFPVWQGNEANITVAGDLPSGNFTNWPGAPVYTLNASILDANQNLVDQTIWDTDNQSTPGSMNFIASMTGYYYLLFQFEYVNGTQAMYSLSLDIDDSIDGGLSHSGSSFDNAPIIRGGLSFDGVDDQVIIPDSPNLRLGTDMTIELWVKTSTMPSDWVRLVGKGVTYRNYGVWIQAGTGRILWQIYSSGGNIDLLGTSTVTDGVWHHVAVTYNGSIMAIYIDGSLDGSAAYTQTPSTSGDPLKLGYGGIHDFYEGLLDEVRIINSSLTAAMVRADHASSPKYPIRPATVAWYQFRENSGAIIADNSGANNTGTIEGGASLDFIETATGLWTSSVYPDYYNVSLYENEILDLSASFIHALGDINLYLYNDSAKTEIIMSSTSHTDKEHLGYFLSPRDATYYLFISSSSSGQRYYDLSFAVLTDDLYEENDYLLFPASLEAKNATYSLFLEKTESDFFNIELSYQDFLNVTMAFNGSIGDLDLALYDSLSGDLLGKSNDSSGNREIVTWLSPTESSVIIRVYAPLGGGISGIGIEYLLIVAISPNDDRFENNDEQEAAYLFGEASVTGLIVRSDDPDYYMFYLLRSEPFQVTLTYAYADGNIDLWILDEEGTVIEKAETLTDDESISSTAPSDGVYYAYVHLADAPVNFYNLTISYTEEGDEFEDNDDPEEATSVSSGTYGEIPVRWGDPDFYSVLIPDVIGIVSIHAEFNQSLGDLGLELFLPNGTLFTIGITLSNTTEGIDLSASSLPFFGEYILRVWLNTTYAVPPLAHDLVLLMTHATPLNTSIYSIPFPDPSREFAFLPEAEVDPVLIAMIFVGGLSAGAVVIIILRRRFGV